MSAARRVSVRAALHAVRLTGWVLLAAALLGWPAPPVDR